MVMTIEESVVGEALQPRAPFRPKGGFALVAVVLVAAAAGFVIARLTFRDSSPHRWHVGQAVVMSSGQVAIISPSGLAPLVPHDVAWVDRSGAVRFQGTAECLSIPGTVQLRWREATVSYQGSFPQPVVVLVDCSG